MKSFYVTTTRASSEMVRQEILRADSMAAIQYRREVKTLLVVMSSTLSEEVLERIPGVSHAANVASLGKMERESFASVSGL